MKRFVTWRCQENVKMLGYASHCCSSTVASFALHQQHHLTLFSQCRKPNDPSIMTSDSNMIKTSDLLVDILIEEGVQFVFGIPGEENLDLLDSLRKKQDDIRLILTRHEQAAGFMAATIGRLTGHSWRGADDTWTWRHQSHDKCRFCATWVAFPASS